LAGIIIFRAGCACAAQAITDAAKTTTALESHLRIDPPFYSLVGRPCSEAVQSVQAVQIVQNTRLASEIYLSSLPTEFFKCIVKDWEIHKLHDRRFFFMGRAAGPLYCQSKWRGVGPLLRSPD
jgi:hypothetical protein